LRGLNIRHHIKIIATGKILTGFHIFRALALGADACNTGRAMMLALGCIQALLCNTNKCPTGVATQNPDLTVGLVISDKKQRVANFHEGTVKGFVELMGAAGIKHPDHLTRSHIYRRASLNKMSTFEEIFPSIAIGSLLEGNIPERYATDFKLANMHKWGVEIPTKFQ
ncbi:MAG: alpha-hydroxy-acid oxidizing protein, partial [Chitinophagaceae bacterium]|nr:alpha-hydroxy-acid oxidizing protein [Chitinophagaceae bacterium]